MSTTANLIKQDNISKHSATPDDEVYLYPMRFFCYLCKGNNGPTKVRQNLWQLAHHFKTCHASECRNEWQTFVSSLEQIIRWRIVR